MRCSCWSDGFVMFSTEKTDMMRCENALRPPPGGAIDAMSWMSLMVLTSCFSLSYQNPLSTHSLSSSSGGMNPKTDFCGMLKSSTYTTIFLPPLGANTPLLRFSRRPSIVFCSELLLVCAEKLMIMELLLSGRDSRHDCATIVLPTPTLPTMSTCRPIPDSVSAIVFERKVSTVGTIILKKGISGGGLYVVSCFSHSTHSRALGSTKYSYTVCSCGHLVSFSRRKTSNFLRESSSREAPTDQMRQNKNVSSTMATYASGSSSRFG